MDDNTSTFIYVLVDPRDNQARYVGKSNRPKRRFQSHLWAFTLADDSYKNFWLKGLLAEGLVPKLLILEKVSRAKWKEAEVFYINHLREQGHSLTNVSAGGGGQPPTGLCTGRKASAEARARMGVAKAKRYVATFPNGTETEVTNLTAFCREHNLDQPNAFKVVTGKHKTYRGFKFRRLDA